MMRIVRSLCSLLCLFIVVVAVSGAAFAKNAAPETAPSGKTSASQTAAAGVPAVVTNPDIDAADLKIRLMPLTKDELATAAAEWLQIVQKATADVADVQVRLRHTTGAAHDALRNRLVKLVTQRNDLFSKFNLVINAWEQKGGDKIASDKAKIATYRAYADAIVIDEARTMGFRTLLARAGEWLTSEDGGIKFGSHIAVILAALIALLIIARIVRRMAKRWIGHVPNLSKLLQAFIVTFIYWIVLALGLLIVLSALGINISPIFALIGGASFILAFAFQDTLSNLASGLMIMIYRPFDEGDYVEVGGVAGTVKAVSIVATTAMTPDNQVIVIPNKQVWGAVITNVTVSPTRRVDLIFGIGYDDSIEEAQNVLETTVAAHPLVLKDPAPTIRVSELADSSVNFIVRPWVRGEDYWAVRWDLMRQVKEAFDDKGISIPFPQRDVHLYTASDQTTPTAPTPPSGSSTAAPDEDRRIAEAQGDEGLGDDDDENTH